MPSCLPSGQDRVASPLQSLSAGAGLLTDPAPRAGNGAGHGWDDPERERGWGQGEQYSCQKWLT